MAARAAERLSPDLRDELSKLNAEMPTLARNGSKLAYSKLALLDSDFHAWISKQSGKELAAELPAARSRARPSVICGGRRLTDCFSLVSKTSCCR
jgi:DNA-binding GntR family transcriptional regulator